MQEAVAAVAAGRRTLQEARTQLRAEYPSRTTKTRSTKRATKKQPTARPRVTGKCGVTACFLMDQSGSMHANQWAQEQSFVVSAANTLATTSNGNSQCACFVPCPPAV